MTRRNRIEDIKQVPFIEALARCCPSVDTEDVPVMITCLLPDHNDKTPSFYLQKHRWHCFGCSRGGDVLDFLQAYHDWDIHRALDHAEASLGIADPDGTDADLLNLQAEAKRVDKAESPEAWEASVDVVLSSFFDLMKPYLRCRDDVVVGIALGRVEYVFSELEKAQGQPPKTTRGKRDRLRDLARWAVDWSRDIAHDVEQATGKDRMDCALQPLYPMAS